MYPNHFLDANVLVASKFESHHHHKIAIKYTVRVERERIKRYTSLIAFKQARRVFEKIRKISGQYLDSLSLYNFTTDRKEILDNIAGCKVDYEQMQDLSIKEKDLLNSVVNDIYAHSCIVDMIQQDTRNGVGNFRDYMLNTIEVANETLRKECKEWKESDSNGSICLFRRDDIKYSDKEARGQIKRINLLKEALSQIIIDDDADVELLIDTHYLWAHLKKDICFVTFDQNHFWGKDGIKKKNIEKILTGIHIQLPNYIHSL